MFDRTVVVVAVVCTPRRTLRVGCENEFVGEGSFLLNN